MEKDEKRLTEHFRMDEFVYSAMAVELGLNNALPSEVIPAIRNLMVRLLEPLRIYHRQPIENPVFRAYHTGLPGKHSNSASLYTMYWKYFSM